MEKRKRNKSFQKMIAYMLSFVFIFTSLFPYGITAQAETVTEDGLILYYDFVLQNSYSTKISDASGNEHAGELKRVGGGSVEGNYSIIDTNIYGKSVKALSLPGGKDGSYLQLPDGILNGNEAVTISMWVKLTTDTAYQRIWDIGKGSSEYMYLLSDGANEGFKGYASGITKSGWSNEKGVQKGTNIDKNRWVLTTLVMDGSKMSLYENGKQIGETTDTGLKVSDLGATTGNYIAYSNCGDAPTKGQFAEVKIYNKALTAAEIAAMYSVNDAGIVAADKEELNLGDTTAVTGDIELPTKGANGSDITWVSGNSAVTIENGVAKVTRPEAGNENVTGKLTATIKYNDATDMKEFDVTVIPAYTDKQNAEYDADWVAKEVGDLSSVMSDLTLPVEGARGSAITWSSDNAAITVDGSVAKVTRPAIGSENATGVLTATVKYGEEQIQKKVDFTVIALREAVSVDHVEDINVTTLKGHSPSLPNYAKVTYTDNSTNKVKTVWPTKIDTSKYAAAGTFDVEGSLVGETKKITAHVTVVDEEEAEKSVVSSNFALKDITLDKVGENGSILTQNRDRDIAYLKLLDNKRMLYNFYNTFGQKDKISGVSPLGGWDEPTGLLRGHSTGHYMSALALAYASTGDETLKTKLDEMVHELRELQKLSKGNAKDFKTNGVKTSTWSTDPTTWGEGFISAYSPDQFALLEQYTPYGSPDSGIWAPYYTLHKLIAGFLDAYNYTGNTEALDAAKGIGTWVCNRLGACSQEQLTKMWDMYIAGEFGGFNESLAQLYIITGDQTYLNGAKLFDNTTFFDKLKVNVDDIATRHANQHIPQIIGAMETYEASVKAGTPEVKYYDIAENFWQMTVSRYAYSIGGVGTGEKFTQPYQQANNISGTTNCETCAAYNMLKLTKMLNNYDPDDAEYMDYYERTLYNQILASQTPNVTANTHNGTTYMLPIGPGSTRNYGGDYDSFTCCHGTGMENHVKYQEAAYVKTDDTLYVGLYLPSTLTWEEKGVTVKQETTFPSEDTKLTVSGIAGKTAESFNMKLRVPYWATNGFTVKVNGVEKVKAPEISTYVTLEGIKAGDTIEINMPYTLHLDKTPDKLGKSEVGSVMYGPFVMAAQINSTDWKTLVLSSNLSDSIKVSKDTATGFPTLTANGYNFAPMFDKQFATEAYDAYFKILTADDDGSKWFEAKITNKTPKNGSFTIDADMVKEGNSLVITAAPNDGYMVKTLTVNGKAVQIGEDNTYTVTNVSEDLTIEGSFRLINPPTPDPKHLEFTATVSSDYTSSWENLDGIMKDWEPTKSAAGTGKGWGNWPQTAGSEHYVQYEWDTEVTMNTFNIYWYDDGGDTAIPGSIKVMYTDKDGSWKEAVMLSKYEDVIAINQYNKIELEPITTSSVKLVLTVKSGKAANGILRWKVSNEDKTPEVVDKTELSADITAAGSKVESAYTAESWKAFAEALANAKKVVADEKATKADIDAAKAALAEAVNGLVDITGLNAAIKAAGAKVESAYTTESWKAFAEALANAKKVVADEKATKADIDAAEAALAKAINGLKEKPSTDNGKDDKNNDQNSGQNNNPSAGQNNGQNNNQNSNQNNNSNGTDNSTTAAIKAGDTVTVKGVVYKVTNADKKEAAAVKPSKKSAKRITIKNTVKINGVSCKVVSISSKAFMGMKKLTKVTIPKNVKTIGSKAFYKDSKLKSVKISATSPKSIGKNAFKGIAKKAKIDVPNKQLKKYKSMLKKAKTASTVKIK